MIKWLLAPWGAVIWNGQPMELSNAEVALAVLVSLSIFCWGLIDLVRRLIELGIRLGRRSSKGRK